MAVMRKRIGAEMIILKSQLLQPGSVVLRRDGYVVWAGPLGAPWEDVECDAVIVSEQDYEEIASSFYDHKSR